VSLFIFGLVLFCLEGGGRDCSIGRMRELLDMLPGFLLLQKIYILSLFYYCSGSAVYFLLISSTNDPQMIHSSPSTSSSMLYKRQ